MDFRSSYGGKVRLRHASQKLAASIPDGSEGDGNTRRSDDEWTPKKGNEVTDIFLNSDV